ncbi:acyltransferase family protein [Frondihabitans australicus]|uniref:Acyltransferase-like protein n=1 Tax=Frondihabitans australicus TaxID=386892 RepID=A0A495IIV7_9MICO|nr:acyltransferase [Frondihabitans australicus]RKR75241.1 acyltransferase-like protein [Frondihabitans australicus]
MSALDRHGERLAWIDVTRGFAVFLVVFYHVVIALAVTPTAAPLWASTLNDAASPFRIPTLMFCSGMLLPRSLGKPTREYIGGKLRNIGWPYVVWTAVIVALLVGGSQVAGHGHYGVSRIWSIVTDDGTYTWYLAYLLLYYLISLVVPARIRTFSIPFLLAASAVIHDGDGWTRLTFLLAFFFLGDAVTRHYPDWLRLVRHRWVEALAAAAALVLAVYSTQVFVRYTLITALGVVGVAILAEPVGSLVARSRVGGWLSAIGRDSIVYYTTHWIVVTAAVHVLDRLHVRNGSVLVVALMVLGVAVPGVMVLLRRRSRIVAALYAWPKRAPSAVRAPRPTVPPAPAVSD